ncbi:hypothetical protein BVRB_021610, partial [Beta vulgaris subsp. vulgaris]
MTVSFKNLKIYMANFKADHRSAL